jgi:hypothetical protein
MTSSSTQLKPTVPTEAQEQRALFEWASFNFGRYPELLLLYHIPNGGSRNAIEAKNLKAQGVKPGVPDVCLPVARGEHSALYIEMKRREGGHLSEVQRDWIALLNRVGNKAVVCKGWEEARDAIIEYLSK